MKLAVVAATWNDGPLLGQFCRHYAEADRIVLCDNESDPGMLDFIPREMLCRGLVEVQTYRTHGEFDDLSKIRALQMAKAGLKGFCDWVLILDSDEFTVPIDPWHKGLKEAIVALASGPVYLLSGWQMVTRPQDAPYDPAAPLPPQRRYGYPDGAYCKPALVRVDYDIIYTPGQHTAPGSKPGEPFLHLLHYRAFDAEAFVRRGTARSRRLSTVNRMRGMGLHYLNKGEDDLRREFREMATHPLLQKVI